MNEAILELVSVRKSFVSDGDNLEILSGIDLSVPESTKTVIIGDSGCGKSTLLNIIGGLDSLSGGSIRAGQYHVHALDERDMSLSFKRFYRAGECDASGIYGRDEKKRGVEQGEKSPGRRTS
jgi:ABC-type lipoprotein export system ATPase subunit